MSIKDNHEDSVVISESFSKKAKAQFIDRIYVPIYEYTLLQKFYNDVEDSFIYFPGIGQEIKEDILCSIISPKETTTGGYIDPKMRIQSALKNMKLSDLLNLQAIDSSKFVVDKIKSKLEHSKLTGFKIHKIRKGADKINMIDPNLQSTLEQLYNHYAKFVVDVYTDLMTQFDVRLASSVMGKYYLYSEDKVLQGRDIDPRSCCYLLEFELTKDEISHVGDKIANR